MEVRHIGTPIYTSFIEYTAAVCTVMVFHPEEYGDHYQCRSRFPTPDGPARE
jgi:hypothetical protein